MSVRTPPVGQIILMLSFYVWVVKDSHLPYAQRPSWAIELSIILLCWLFSCGGKSIWERIGNTRLGARPIRSRTTPPNRGMREVLPLSPWTYSVTEPRFVFPYPRLLPARSKFPIPLGLSGFRLLSLRPRVRPGLFDIDSSIGVFGL